MFGIRYSIRYKQGAQIRCGEVVYRFFEIIYCCEFFYNRCYIQRDLATSLIFDVSSCHPVLLVSEELRDVAVIFPTRHRHAHIMLRLLRV